MTLRMYLLVAISICENMSTAFALGFYFWCVANQTDPMSAPSRIRETTVDLDRIWGLHLLLR